MDVFDTYYHDQDHLGNIRQVTDKSGKAVQTTDYYPFGMQLCDGTTSNIDQNHKYNGKEFDTMHGLNTYDYGARQYNPVTARWDRMDPLCEKYYSVSPYAYCMNNPINAIDPDGRDNYRLNRDGTIELIENTSDDYHLIYSVNENGSINANSPFIASKKFFDNVQSATIKGKASEEFGGAVSEYDAMIYTNNDKSESAHFFEFAANNTEVEWSLVETDEYSQFGTSFSSGDDVSNPYMLYQVDKNNVNRDIHSHDYGNSPVSYGDVNLAKEYPNVKFYIYDRVGYHPFDQNSPVIACEFIVTGSLAKSKRK